MSENELNGRDRFYYNINLKYFMEGDNVVVHSFDNGKYYYLEGVSAEIWLNLDGIKSIDEIVNIIDGNYEASYNVIKNDVYAFLNDLLSNELIESVKV